MNASIQYNEIKSFVEKNYKIKIGIKGINQKSVEISYKASKLFPTIAIKLHIARIDKDCIELTYESNTAIELIMSGGLELIKENIPNGVSIDTQERIVKVYLAKFDKLEKVLEFVSLSDISFADDAVNASLTVA